jgi:hypothetical protein
VDFDDEGRVVSDVLGWHVVGGTDTLCWTRILDSWVGLVTLETCGQCFRARFGDQLTG